MLQRAVSARQFRRHAWSSPKRRLAAHICVVEFLWQKRKGGLMKYLLLIAALTAAIGTATATPPAGGDCCKGKKCCGTECCKK
jgi:hypothetical protein